jgi:putative FmdB family regulatory protein
MPTYDYRCTSPDCPVDFELHTTIAERDEPTLVECPSCGGTIARYLSSPPGFGDPMRLGRIKPPKAFNDVLKNVKSKMHRNTINTWD